MASGHARVGDRRPAPGLTEGPGDEGPANHADEPFEDEEWEAPAVVTPPPWRAWAALVLCLAGTGVSTYLTVAHFTSAATLACPATATINCEKVTTSAQSEVFGIFPVAVLGLAYFVAMTLLDLPPLWRRADRRVHLLRLAGAVVGMGFVLYLLVAELYQIGAICLWCTSVHVLTFLLFLLVITTVPAMVGWAPARWATDGEPG